MRMRSIALLLAAALITLPLSAEACSWKLISSPNPGANNVLQGVSGSSTSDVWSVGKYYSTSGGPFTLAEHWNGSTWSVVSTPNPASGNNLYGVADIASNDAWAVGSERPSSGGFQALILHWNGKKWSQVTAPTLAGHFTNLQAIAGINSTNIWADGLALPVSGGILGR